MRERDTGTGQAYRSPLHRSERTIMEVLIDARQTVVGVVGGQQPDVMALPDELLG